MEKTRTRPPQQPEALRAGMPGDGRTPEHYAMRVIGIMKDPDLTAAGQYERVARVFEEVMTR